MGEITKIFKCIIIAAAMLNLTNLVFADELADGWQLIQNSKSSSPLLVQKNDANGKIGTVQIAWNPNADSFFLRYARQDREPIVWFMDAQFTGPTVAAPLSSANDCRIDGKAGNYNEDISTCTSSESIKMHLNFSDITAMQSGSYDYIVLTYQSLSSSKKNSYLTNYVELKGANLALVNLLAEVEKAKAKVAAEHKPQLQPAAAATTSEYETATISSLDNNQKIALSVISTEKLGEVFKVLDSRQDIPFDYVMEGQYARVHKMVLILEEEGIIAGKAVVIGDIAFDSAFGKIDLRYHMAAIVLVQGNGSPAIYALDPALFSRPVPYEDWKAKTLSGRRRPILKHEYFTNRFAYDPADRTKNLDSYDKEALEDMESTNANFARVFGMYLEVSPDYRRVRD